MPVQAGRDSAREIQHHSWRHLAFSQALEDRIDGGQGLQVDVGLDLAVGGEGQVSAMSRRLPTKEPYAPAADWPTHAKSADLRLPRRALGRSTP